MAEESNKSDNPKGGSTEKKKQLFLDAFEDGMAIVTDACKSAGIVRSTYYRWRKKDEDFKEKADKILNRRKEFVEDSVAQQVKDGYFPAQKFWLARKHPDWKKKEKREVEHSGEIEGGGQQKMDAKEREVSKKLTNGIKEAVEEAIKESTED